ncbi:related to flavin-nucleotide-binding protein [Cephalotrichum gorgonifer]|uniref:Related to flavin-nucleotide-binding protein n=1 Tax=Cephalotrichum gorgonifer TaxID=2041049 RepID=A0AAE8N7P6_9PEZI|nr:related to flavin-nucleotide-binding protein [Cephalotrichum gorgonifer]
MEYPKEAINSVKRHRERGDYSLDTIHGIIQESQLVHVSFIDPKSPFPVVLPMIGTMGSFTDQTASLGDPLDLYLHGYVSHRIMNLSRADSSDEGMPVTVAASHVDGLVLALSAFSHSYNYRSATLFGHATVVEDEAEKLYAMELITNKVVPGRWDHTRLPLTKTEIKSTGILRVKVASGSAKIRDAEPKDERVDMKNEEALDSVWTGVVPIWTAVGEPVPSSYNRVVDVPTHVTQHVQELNATNRRRVEKSHAGK